MATISVVCASDHFNSCTSNDETRNTSNDSEVISEGGPVKLSTALPHLCAPSCRRGWSSRREISSGRPLWEVAGPLCLPGDSPGQPESHHLWQPPLLQWQSEEGPHAVAEAELQGTRMDQPQLVPTLFKWSIFQSPLSGFVIKGEGGGGPGDLTLICLKVLTHGMLCGQEVNISQF